MTLTREELATMAVLVVGVFLATRVYRAGRGVVPTDHVGIIRRRYGSSDPDPRFRKITPRDARGIQARIFLPDRPYWLVPGLYTVELVSRTYVPEGMVGLVSANDGAQRPVGRPVGRYVECDQFQDGQAFLLNGGEQGRQVQVLPGGTSYYINTALFSVQVAPRTYVPPGTVGLVVAMVGGIRPPDQPLGRFLECDNFQDARAFLHGGGEQGRQLAVLTGGTYYDINPAIFTVITTENVSALRDGLAAEHLREIAIPVGHTGVVITLDGAEPTADGATVGPNVEGHRSFRLPWVFLNGGGHRGVQQETLGEGAVCSLNPWFVRVMLIPIRLLYMEWTKKNPSESGNYDANLDQIVVNIQGHRLHVEMSQTLRIPKGAAPQLVSQFGGTTTSGLGGLVNDPVPVQRFVERVLGATVAAYFNAIATASTIDEFLNLYAGTRTDLAAQVRNTLQSWGVEAVSTTLGEFESQDPEFDEVRKKEFAEQMRGKVLLVERENIGVEDEIDAVRVRAEERRTSLELKAEIEALGVENVAQIRMIREISRWQGPQYIGGNISEYVDSMPMMIRRDLIDKLRQLRTTVDSPEPKAFAGNDTHMIQLPSEGIAEDEPEPCHPPQH
jgi:hypothetical protein